MSIWNRFALIVCMVASIDSMSATSCAGQQTSQAKPNDATDRDDALAPEYPLAVCADGDGIFCVDLNLPGIWRCDHSRRLFVRGDTRLRQPLNRPRCITNHPGGGILVGDSATRDVYFVATAGAEPVGLTDGQIGIPMALAIAPDRTMVYVGDAEKRATFRFPVEGGKPEMVARVNARGLAFDAAGQLWAVTPDDAAVIKIDVATKQVTPVVTGRPFQYPSALCWAGKHGYVTDGYGKCVWRFAANGEVEKWHDGEPLSHPVGITATDHSLFVADPKRKQVYEFDRKSKAIKTRL